MKLIVALCFVAVVAAMPPPGTTFSNDNISLLRNDKDATADGGYSFKFEQSDGQMRDEQGQMKSTGSAMESLSVKGSYHWIGPDGVDYTVIYVADENGFKPEIQQGPGGAVPAHVASMLG